MEGRDRVGSSSTARSPSHQSFLAGEPVASALCFVPDSTCSKSDILCVNFVNRLKQCNCLWVKLIPSTMADRDSLCFDYCEDWYCLPSKGFVVSGYLAVHKSRCVRSPSCEEMTSTPVFLSKVHLPSVSEDDCSAPAPADPSPPPSNLRPISCTEIPALRGGPKVRFEDCLGPAQVIDSKCH